jgi:hypothetical protein
MAAAVLLSQGTVQAAPQYCPGVKLADGMRMTVYERVGDASDGQKAYTAAWAFSDRSFNLFLAAQFDVTAQPVATPYRMRITVFNAGALFAAARSPELVVNVEGAKPWRGPLPRPVDGVATAFITAEDRPDLMAAFMTARKASLRVVTRKGVALESASAALPSEIDWRGLSDGVAAAVARAKSDQPCLLPKLRVHADGSEGAVFR